MASIHLTRRALLDIKEIKGYSTDKWGDKVAAEYLQSIEDGLSLLGDNPQLLKEKPQVSNALCFYRVRQHFLVCIQLKQRIFVLTLKHGAMDLPSRIAELEPQLIREAQILYERLQRSS